MIAALFAVALALFVIIVCANPIWLGSVVTGVSVLIPIPLKLQARAVSLSKFRIYGLKIVIKQLISVNVDAIAFNIWPLRICIANVHGLVRIEERERVENLPPSPEYFKQFIPSLVSFALKFLSLLCIEIRHIHFRALPIASVLSSKQNLCLSIDSVTFNRGKTLHLTSLNLQAFETTANIRNLEAHIQNPWISRRTLSVSIDDVRCRIRMRLEWRISTTSIMVSKDSLEAVLHVITARSDCNPFCFIGGAVFSFRFFDFCQSLAIFGCRLDLDPIADIVSYSRPVMQLFPDVPKTQHSDINLQLYGADIQVSAIHHTLVLAYLQEIEVQTPQTITVSIRKLHSSFKSQDFVRISFLSLRPSESVLSIEADSVTFTPQFELAPLLLPITNLFVELCAFFPSSGSTAKPMDVNLIVNSLQAALPRMFDVIAISVKIEVTSQEFVVNFVKPACLYETTQFLSLGFVKVSGCKQTSCFPHPTVAVSADAARGHWSPSMQYDLMYLIKQIVATVIRCKRDLFPLLFSPNEQMNPSCPSKLATGLPRGEQSFYDWAFRDRAPYLAEKLQIFSLCVTDILLTAAIESSMTLTIFSERFASDFLPWHWHVSRFALCLNSFPLFHMLSLNVSRDSECPNIGLSDIKCDPFLTEQTVQLLMYSPISISVSSISLRVPSLDSGLYTSILPLSILYQSRGLLEVIKSIPSIDELARLDNGPGYSSPPSFTFNSPIRFRCLHFSFCFLDTPWDSWIHHVRPVVLDERMGSISRRELLRLKIRDHQRRTGQLLSDAKISLMSSRLAESNFDLYRNRIIRLKAIHAEKWAFPPLDCISEVLRPGNLHLGSLLSVSIADLDCTSQVFADCNTTLFNVNCSLQSESLEISLRQFCPSVVDFSKLKLHICVSLMRDDFVPARSCNLSLSPRHQFKFQLPLRPPLISVRVDKAHIEHPCITLSPILLPTLNDILLLCRNLRPSFFDESISSLSIFDLSRYVIIFQEAENVTIDSFSIRIVQQMAFCTSTEALSSLSFVVRGSHFKIRFSNQSNVVGIALNELTVSVVDEQHDSNTLVHMSHESVYKPEFAGTGPGQEFYETGVLLHCFNIDGSVKLCFVTSSGLPCSTRLALNSSQVDPSEPDAFHHFRTNRIAINIKVSLGSAENLTKASLNTQNLPFLLRLYQLLPSVPLPDFSAILLRCSQFSMLNCSFSLLDVERDEDPGQGLRFRLDEIHSKFEFESYAIHNLSITLSNLNASLVANDAFWRKCETGHELANDIRNGTVVVVHTYENQRFILGQGWLNRLLPTDRPNWSDIDGNQELRRESPLFDLPSEHWQWKSDWVIDRGQLCGKGKVDADGWEYAHDFPRTYTAKRHWTDNVRRRRWFRVRRLIDSVDEKMRIESHNRLNRRQNGLLFIVDACRLEQKPCSTLIFKIGSPLQSPLTQNCSVESPESPPNASQVKRATSLLTFFSIGTQPSPLSGFDGSPESLDSSSADNTASDSPDARQFSSPYLFSVKVVNPKARMTLESRNSLVQLLRSYYSHFEYYYRLRSAPTKDQGNAFDEKDNDDEIVFSVNDNSDDEEADLDEAALTDSIEDDAVQGVSGNSSLIPRETPDPDSINPVDLFDIFSIEILNGQVALESPVESACAIVLACMQSCLITARSFDGDGSKHASERVDCRLLIDNLTIRIAPTDIDVDAKPMWFDFDETSSQSVMKAIFNPFPVQASAMFFPFSASSHNIFLLLPTITATIDHLQCALLESIASRVLLAELPLPPLQSATEFVRFAFAGVSAFDGRITNHQRLLWQLRHLEWLMGVYSASESSEDADDDKSGSGELALLSAHLCGLRQQFVDSIMSVSVDLYAHISGLFSSNPFDLHFRQEAFIVSLVSINRVEILRATVTSCSGLFQIDFKGEGSLQACFDIRDIRVIDSKTEMEDWRTAVIPAYLCGSNGLASMDSDQNVENRAVVTLQCVAKRVGGIIVICSCVLNAAHLVIRITQSLIDDLTAFFSSPITKAEKKLLQNGTSIVPKASGVLAEVNAQETSSTTSERVAEIQGHKYDESTPAHLRDLRLYSERSQNTIIITYLKIGAVRATISFKGYGSGAIADFQGVSVKMPAMMYQKKTWTMRQFARRLRRDLIKAALRQAGPGLASFLRYKFGGASTDMSSFTYASNEDLSALDIDIPVGSIPIQPSPHPIAKAKTAVGDIINKFKSSSTDSDRMQVGQTDEAEKDPDKRYLLFGKQSSS